MTDKVLRVEKIRSPITLLLMCRAS